MWFCAYVDGLAQDCSNSSALAMELLQSGANPSICDTYLFIADILASCNLIDHQKCPVMFPHLVN